jgi:hypothetical protein
LILKYVSDTIGFKPSEIKRELQKGHSSQGDAAERRLFGSSKISKLSYEVILEYVRENV